MEIIRGKAEYTLQDNRRKDAIVKASDFNPIQKNQVQREQIRKRTNNTTVLEYSLRLSFNKVTVLITPSILSQM